LALYTYKCSFDIDIVCAVAVGLQTRQLPQSPLQPDVVRLFVIDSRQTPARWRRRHVTVWRRAVTSLVTSRRRRWRSWPSRTTTRDTSHRADDRTRNWHSLREM